MARIGFIGGSYQAQAFSADCQVSNVGPVFSAEYAVNSISRDSELSPNIRSTYACSRQSSDLQYLSGGKFSAAVSFALLCCAWNSKNSMGMDGIFGWGHVLKIFKYWLVTFAVLMVNLHPGWPLTYERLHDENVNVVRLWLTVFAKRYYEIAIAVYLSFKNLLAPDIAKVAYFVKTLISDNRLPLFLHTRNHSMNLYV